MREIAEIVYVLVIGNGIEQHAYFLFVKLCFEVH